MEKTAMATVETITLVIAIFWALWQLLSLRDAAINGEGVFPAMIPSFFLFVGAIATVLLLHLSPLHLIWLAVVCFLAGLPVMLIGPIQEASMGFFVLLAMTGKPSKDEESRKSQTTTAQNFQEILEKSAQPKSQKSSKNAKGFGT
jgi:hypothetical protein